MKAADFTRDLILFSAVAFGLVDVVLARWFGIDASISMVLYRLSQENPIVAVAVGVLVGHWFWPQATD